MEIILKEDVVNLGYKDDIVKVKDGYGRNYLIPQGKAVIATESAKKVLAEAQRQRAHKIEKLKNDAQEMAAKLAAVEGLTIAAKASENGKIFGSVTNVQVAEALEKQSLTVDRKSIVMEPVKELGAAKAVVKLYKEIHAEVAFTVVAEEE